MMTKQMMTSEEEKEVRLDILKYIDQICRENNIKYSLTGGTLLGAIRHGGFIPWDDDIDVFMTRDEYKKFEELLKTERKYLWLTNKKDSNYFLTYGRLIDKNTLIEDEGIDNIVGYGVFVDVCVVDGLPNNNLLRKMHYLKMRFLYRSRRCAAYSHEQYIPKNRAKRIVKSIYQNWCRKIGVAKWVKWLDRTAQKYSFNEGKYVGNLMSQYGGKEIMHKSSFDDYIEMPFEGINFMVIKGWKEYLTNIYGNYMQLPPVEKRKGHHTGKAYWINRDTNC